MIRTTYEVRTPPQVTFKLLCEAHFTSSTKGNHQIRRKFVCLFVCLSVRGFLAKHHAAAVGWPRCSSVVIWTKSTELGEIIVFWTGFKWSPGTVSVDRGVQKTVFWDVFGSVSNEVQEQYLWIEGSRKRWFGPVSNEVQEQYLWIEKPNKWDLRAPALQSVV